MAYFDMASVSEAHGNDRSGKLTAPHFSWASLSDSANVSRQEFRVRKNIVDIKADRASVDSIFKAAYGREKKIAGALDFWFDDTILRSDGIFQRNLMLKPQSFDIDWDEDRIDEISRILHATIAYSDHKQSLAVNDNKRNYEIFAEKLFSSEFFINMLPVLTLMVSFWSFLAFVSKLNSGSTYNAIFLGGASLCAMLLTLQAYRIKSMFRKRRKV